MFVIFLSIDVYSFSILQGFSYQVFRVYVEHTRRQYTTLSNTSLYCNFFRCFIFISHCSFLLEVNLLLIMFISLSGTPAFEKHVMLNSVKCLGVINETNVQCFCISRYLSTSIRN